jgi:hypothetical protein
MFGRRVLPRYRTDDVRRSIRELCTPMNDEPRSASGDDRPDIASTSTVSGILGGVLLTIPLHVAASLIVIVAFGVFGLEYAVFYFWLGIAVFEWLYLVPAARLANARRWPGIARGIFVAGCLTAAWSLVQYVMMMTGSMNEWTTGNTPPNTVYACHDSVVVAVDATSIAVRGLGAYAPRDGATVSDTFRIGAETTYDFRGPGSGLDSTLAGPRWLSPGRQVCIDYVFRNHEKEARLVAIRVEAAESVR